MTGYNNLLNEIYLSKLQGIFKFKEVHAVIASNETMKQSDTKCHSNCFDNDFDKQIRLRGGFGQTLIYYKENHFYITNSNIFINGGIGHS